MVTQTDIVTRRPGSILVGDLKKKYDNAGTTTTLKRWNSDTGTSTLMTLEQSRWNSDTFFSRWNSHTGTTVGTHAGAVTLEQSEHTLEQ